MAESLSNDNNTCVVCFKNVVFFSIGECDHPVCFECSTRMRVLCLQNECPICRGGLERVVFTDSIQPYKSLRNKTFSERLFERQYKIGFCNEEIKNAYEKLLENCCKLCDNIPPFRTFTMLSEHMRKIHEKYYCDLCVKHLKIFTSERKCYSRHELAHHRRKGDLDDTSHRGHPLCEFCEERFMDADELYRHLRKEHLYCHLCDADGRNLYYSSHQALAHHFRTDHYLCEEGECAGQHLTAVFRSEIDLKAHRATVHGRGMTRGAARQARTLELQFNITPHPVVQRAPRDRERERERERERAEPVIPPAPAPAPEQRIDTRSDEHFPRLSAAPAAPHLVLGPASSRPYRGESGNLARNDRNFPALDGGASRPGVAATPTSAPRPAAPVAAAILRNSKPSVSIQLHSQPASASNFRLTQASGSRISIPPQQKRSALSDDDFPSLGIAKDDHPNIGASTVQPPKVTLINSQEMSAMKHTQHNNQPKKPQLSSEAFPALSASSTPTTPPKWITVSKSKEKNKPSKPEPPPQPKEISFNQVADFPTLPINNSKSKSKKSPQPNQVINNQSEIKNKKEKKKNNNAKKENISDLNIVNGANYKNNVKIHYEAATSESIPNNKIEKKIKTVDTPSGTVTSEKRNGTGDYKMASKDYPPLNPKSDDCPPLNMKIENYPPSNQRSENLTKKIPNGSGSPGSKPRPPCDGMTFTNSSGQTFSAPVHTYIPPTNFEHRNRALVNKFVSALGSADALESFKVASRAFRDSILNADEFYEHCQKAMGTEFESLFPELVALLPDIAKQQELVVGRKVPQLDVCSTCGQLLAPCDKIGHDTAHWPPLGR